jgi:energy-converting hydrogenase Eha subunit E
MGAIAVVAYVVANVLHEGVGHAGACLALGCEPQTLTTAYFESDSSSPGRAVARLISAAGTLVNLAAGGIFLALHRRLRQAGGALRYFLWLSFTINLLVGTGYPLFSGALGLGDWMLVVEGWGRVGLWRLVLAAAGVILYAGAVWLSLRELSGLIGPDRSTRVGRAVRLTVPAYVIGSTASTLGALLNPAGAAFVLTSAAAHFGGTSGLAWMAQMLDSRWFPPMPGEPLRIERSWPWVVLAAAALLIHVAVLGPGVRFEA